MATDRKADRHTGAQVPVSARLDRPDYDHLEDRRKALGISRRAAIIRAIRDWLSPPAERITIDWEQHWPAITHNAGECEICDKLRLIAGETTGGQR